MLPAAETPAARATPVWRHTEVVVEREVLTVHYRGGAAVVGECPQCGCEVLMRDAKLCPSSPAVDQLDKPNPGD
jgi:hypothetical protein